jgi:hypothetical protein
VAVYRQSVRIGIKPFEAHDQRFFLQLNHSGHKTEFLLNNIYKLSSYLTGNTLRLRYKAQPVNAV